jgi:hypothetical protein
MNLLQWPFILLKRSKDDYSGGGPFDGNAAIKFAHDVFDPIDAQLVDSQLTLDSDRTVDISEKLLRYAKSIDTNGSIDESDAGALRTFISENTDWLDQLDAWAAANPIGGPPQPPPFVEQPIVDSVPASPTNFVDSSNPINTTGSQIAQDSLYSAAQDLAAELTGNDPSATNYSSTGAVATNVANQPVSNSSTAVNQNQFHDIIADIANDYSLSRNEERLLENVFSKNQDLTRVAVDQFISDNPTTWRSDLAIFDVAVDFNLTPSQTTDLIEVMRANTGWNATDARNYLDTVDPSQYEQVLSQAADAVKVAATNNMNVSQTQMLTTAMVSNSGLVTETVQEIIDQNPSAWARVLEVNDFAATLPNISEGQKNTLIFLAKESSTWTLDHLKEVIEGHQSTWQKIVSEEEFFIKNEMSNDQISLVKEFVSVNPNTSILDMQAYIDGHTTTWVRDLTRSHEARELAGEHQLNVEQTQQLERYMVKFPTVLESALENQMTTDFVSFKRALIVFDVSEDFQFNDTQKQELDLILRTNPDWTARDVKAYLAAHPTDWMHDITQFGNASVLTLNHNLSDQQESVLQSYLLSNPQVDAVALDALITDDPAAFDLILANVTGANEIANAHNFTQDQREQLVRVMSDGPKYTEEQVEQFIDENGSTWGTALRQIDATYIVARALELSEADRDIVQKLMMANHSATANGVAYFIQQNPSDWRNELGRMELSARRGLSDYEDSQLKVYMQQNKSATLAQIDAYIDANPGTWKNDLKLNLAGTIATEVATQHAMSAEDQQVLTLWMASNPRLTVEKVSDLIANEPQAWQQTLERVKTADAFAKSHNFSDQDRELLIRIMVADSSITSDAVATLVSQSPNQWRMQLERIDGAFAIGEALHLSAEDQALVKRGMLMFSAFDFNTMAGFIAANETEWKTKLKGIIEQAIENSNPLGKHVDGGILVAAGNGLTPGRVEWTYIVSFEDFKTNFDFNDQSKWVEQDVKIADAYMSYSGKNEITIPAQYERRLAPPTPEILEQMYIQQYGSPIDKARGHLLGSYSYTEISYVSKDQTLVGPTTQRYADFGVLDASQTTGDGRNRDMAWTGNFYERIDNFTGSINGVSYKDVDAETVKYLDGPAYLARQLSDFAKANEFSYENPSGDNAVQLGIYLDMLGIKDVNNLYVKDGRYVDISTGKDLGAYKEGDPFCFSAYGTGWNDFMPNLMDDGRVVLFPKWASTSDAGTIALVVAVVATIFTAGAAGVALAGAASGASVATSIGAAVGLSGAAATGFGAAVIGTGVRLIAGEQMSFGDAVKSIAVGTVGGWAGGQLVGQIGASGSSFGAALYNAGVSSIGSTMTTNLINGNGLTDNLLSNIGTSLIGAGVGYGINTLNTNVFENALNSQAVNVISNITTTVLLNGSNQDILLAGLRGLAPSSEASGGSTAMTAEQRAFLEANGLVTVDVVNDQGVLTGSYLTTLPDGTQRQYFNDDNGNPSHIDKYYSWDQETGTRILVTETYDTDGIQTHRSTEAVTGFDITNPTANIHSVITPNDASVGGSTISYGIDGSAGVVIKDANGLMTGEVRINDTTVVTYSVGANGEQLEHTSSLNPGGQSANQFTQNLSDGTLSSLVLINGEPKTISITNTSDRFTSVAAGENRAEVTYSDGSKVIVDTQTGKALSGTIQTMAGETTFNGNEITTLLHTGGTVVENTLTNVRVTTIDNVVTTQGPGFTRIEKYTENATRIQIETTAEGQSVRVFAESFEDAKTTAESSGLTSATFVLDDQQLMDFVASNAGPGAKSANPLSNIPYTIAIDETTGVSIKNYGDKGSVIVGTNNIQVGEVRINPTTVVSFTQDENGQQEITTRVEDPRQTTQLYFSASTGLTSATYTNPATGESKTAVITNTDLYTDTPPDSDGNRIRTFSSGETIKLNSSSVPIEGTITTLNGQITYSGSSTAVKTVDGFTNYRAEDGRTWTEDANGKTIKVLSGDGKSGMYYDDKGREVTFNDRISMINDGTATAVTDLARGRTVVTDNLTGKIGVILGGTQSEAFAEARRVNGANGVFYWDNNPNDNIAPKAFSTQTQQELARANGVSDADYLEYVKQQGGEQFGDKGSALGALKWTQARDSAYTQMADTRMTAALGNEAGLPGINQMVVNLRQQTAGLGIGETRFTTGADGNIISVKHLGDNVFVADLGNNQNVTFRDQGSFVAFRSTTGATFTRSADSGEWSAVAAPTALNQNTGSVWNGLGILKDQIADQISNFAMTLHTQNGQREPMSMYELAIAMTTFGFEKIAGFTDSVNQSTGGNSFENGRIYMGAVLNLAWESVSGIPEAFTKFNDPNATDVERAAALVTLAGGIATVVGGGAVGLAGLKGVAGITTGGLAQAGRTGIQVLWEAVGGITPSGSGATNLTDAFKYTGIGYSGTGISSVDNWLRNFSASDSGLKNFTNVADGPEFRAPGGLPDTNQIGFVGNADAAFIEFKDSMRNLTDWQNNFSDNANVSQASKNIVANGVVDDVVISTRSFLDNVNLNSADAGTFIDSVKNDLRVFVTSTMDSGEANRILATLDDRFNGKSINLAGQNGIDVTPIQHTDANQNFGTSNSLPDDLDWDAFVAGELKPRIEGQVYDPNVRAEHITQAPQIPEFAGEDCGARAIRLNNLLTGQNIETRIGSYVDMDFARSFGWENIVNHGSEAEMLSFLGKQPEGSTFLIGMRANTPNGVGHVVNAQIIEGKLVIRDAGLPGRYNSSDMAMFSGGKPENYDFFTVNSTVANPDSFLNGTFNLNSSLNRVTPGESPVGSTSNQKIPDDWMTSPNGNNNNNLIPEGYDPLKDSTGRAYLPEDWNAPANTTQLPVGSNLTTQTGNLPATGIAGVSDTGSLNPSPSVQTLTASEVLPGSDMYKALNMIADGSPQIQLQQFSPIILDLANSRTVADFATNGQRIADRIAEVAQSGSHRNDLEFLRAAARADFVENVNKIFSTDEARLIIQNFDQQLGYKPVVVPPAYQNYYSAVGIHSPNSMSVELNFARDLTLFQTNPQLLRDINPNLFLTLQRSSNELATNSTNSVAASLATTNIERSLDDLIPNAPYAAKSEFKNALDSLDNWRNSFSGNSTTPQFNKNLVAESVIDNVITSAQRLARDANLSGSHLDQFIQTVKTDLNLFADEIMDGQAVIAAKNSIDNNLMGQSNLIGDEAFVPTYTKYEGNIAALTVADSHISSVRPIDGPGSALLITFDDGSKGVWKPLRSSDSGDLSAPELAAYDVSQLIGENFVPTVAYRSHNGEMGTIQLFVDSDTAFLRRQGLELENNPIRTSFFDALIGNPDRNGGNYLTASGRMVLIDNAAAFSKYESPLQRFRDDLSREFRTHLQIDLDNIGTGGSGNASDRLQTLLPSRPVFDRLVTIPDDVWRTTLSKNLTDAEINSFITNKNLLVREIQELETEFGASILGNSKSHFLETRALSGSDPLPTGVVNDVSDTDFAQYFSSAEKELPQSLSTSTDSPDRLLNMNSNTVTNPTSASAYYANFDLNAYYRGFDNVMDHKTYRFGSQESSGGISASAEALRDAGFALSRGDGAAAAQSAEGALKELTNLRSSIDLANGLESGQFRAGVYTGEPGRSQIFSIDSQGVVLQINPFTNANGTLANHITVSFRADGVNHLLRVDIGKAVVSLDEAILAIKARGHESIPLIDRMIHDAQAVSDVGRLDAIINATPAEMAAQRMAEDMVRIQNYVGASNVVNGNIPGQGQIGVGAGGDNIVIRLNRSTADITHLDDGLVITGIDGQVSGITHQEVVHANDVLGAKEANGLSPQLGGTKDVDFAPGYSGGEQMVYRTEVEGNQASIRGYLQGYIDALAIGDRQAASRIVAELPMLHSQTFHLNEGFMAIDRSALSSRGQNLIETTLRHDLDAEVLNAGFKRYVYDIQGEYGERIRYWAEVPENSSHTEVLRLIKQQHESGLKSGMAIEQSLAKLERDVQNVINHADFKGIDPIKTNYSEAWVADASNTGDRVMNMNLQVIGDLKVPDQANDVIRRSAMVLWGNDLNAAEVAALFKAAQRPQKALEYLRAVDFPEERIDQLFQRSGANEPYDPSKFQKLHMMTDAGDRAAISLGGQPRMPGEGSQAIVINHANLQSAFTAGNSMQISAALDANRAAIRAEISAAAPHSMSHSQIINFVNEGLKIQDALPLLQKYIGDVNTFKQLNIALDRAIATNLANSSSDLAQYAALQLQQIKFKMMEAHFTKLYPDRFQSLDFDKFYNLDEAGAELFEATKVELERLSGLVRPSWPKA